MVFWIITSVSESTELVASSITRILQFLTSARDIASNWPSPMLCGSEHHRLHNRGGYHNTYEKLSPSSATCASNLNLGLHCPVATSPFVRKPQRFKASFSAASVCSPSGSRFCLIVPLNKNGSCGMAESLRRRTSRSTVAKSTPFTRILPFGNSTSRNNARKQEVFPAPVLPTIPICRRK